MAGPTISLFATPVIEDPMNTDRKQRLIICLIFPVLLIILILAGCSASGKKIRINGDSMEPNFHDGQVLLVEPVSPVDLQRGNVILYSIGDDRQWLKRLVGLPGETVEIRDGQVFINGEASAETYEVKAPGYTMAAKKLQEDEYFVLGDNRHNSFDSHHFGPVKADQILGRAKVD